MASEHGQQARNPLTPASQRISRNFGTAKTPSFDSNAARLEGVLTLGLRDLFSAVEQESVKTFIVRCSYFEIYNDYVYDLLAALEQLDTPMHVCEDSKRKDFYVKGLKEYMVSNLEECLEILKIGETNRHYAATSMNH